MHPSSQGQRLLVAALVCLICSGVVRRQMRLLSPKNRSSISFSPPRSWAASKPAKASLSWRLTLSDGTTTHDASFQAIDDTRPTCRWPAALKWAS